MRTWHRRIFLERESLEVFPSPTLDRTTIHQPAGVRCRRRHYRPTSIHLRRTTQTPRPHRQLERARVALQSLIPLLNGDTQQNSTLVSGTTHRKRCGTLLSTHTGKVQRDRRHVVERSPHFGRTTHLYLPFHLSRTDAQEFRDLSPSHHDHLLDIFARSIFDQQNGIATQTLQKQAGSFDRWKRFLRSVGIEDEWLTKFKQHQRTQLLSAFASSCRRNEHGKTKRYRLTGKTVKSTVTHVRSVFRTNLRPDPGLDPDQKMSLFLTRQIAGYTDADPLGKQQKALPLSVFRKLYENNFTPLDKALGQLACGAFFFGMRSCEYLTVRGGRKTKQLKIDNIRFFKNNVELTNKNSPFILYADSVSITFLFQKNRQKNITVTQPRSGKNICPVYIWGSIVRRVLEYKGTSGDTYVNTVMIGNKIHNITRDEMMRHLRNTVDNMNGLGFKGSDVGTHSIRSSLAMALYLKKRMVSTIMLIGRWSSDAFLLYIRRQIQEFSAGVSADMVSQENFFTIPDIAEDPLDPRTSNNQSFATTISLNGPTASTAHVKRTALHVWH